MAKKLLMGNEAFAHAALEAGVNVVSGYPGTPSSEVIETIARMHKSGKAEGVYVEWSTNEKAALELAAAASMSGARALFTCKQVGLNVASDALLSLNYVGVRGGLVLFVADDPGPISSQTEQDTRRFAAFAKVPVLDPATPEQGVEMIKQAFKLSEEHKTPVIIRPTTRIDHASTFFDVQTETHARRMPKGGFERDPNEWVIFPKRAYRAHGEINKRLQSMAHEFTYDPDYSRFNEGFEKLSNGMARPLPPLSIELEKPAGAGNASAEDDLGKDFAAAEQMGVGDPQILKAFTGANKPTLGIVTGGVSTQYALEALQLIEEEAARSGIALPSYRFMQIGTPYPFPRRLVGRFLKDLSDVLVLEELDSVIEEDLLKAAGMSFLSPNIHGKLTDEANTRGENTTEDTAFRIAQFFDKYRKNKPYGSDDERSITFESLVENKVGPNALLTYSSKLPARAPVLCAGCPHRGSFYAMKKAVEKLKIPREEALFCGDIGCYTLGNANPLDAADTCLCMGAGVAMAQGFAQTNPDKKSIAFIGDSTFFASGMTGIANAVYNQHDITICVLNNATTAMTGSQPHPGTGVTLMGPPSKPIDIAGVLEALGVKDIAHVNPLDLEQAESACIDALENSEPNAIIFESPCVWLEPFGDPALVHVNLCTGCKRCIKEIGCPAIGFDPNIKGAKSGRRGQAVIDTSQCNGCGLCLQVCPFSAIDIVTAEERELYESAKRAAARSSDNAPGSVDLDGSDSRRSRRSSQRSRRTAKGQQLSDAIDDDLDGSAEIGDDRSPVEDIAEPEESSSRDLRELEDFEDYDETAHEKADPIGRAGKNTGFTSTNIYGDLDAEAIRNKASKATGSQNVSRRLANLGKGFTGTIGLDAIGSDFDGFVDSLINGLAASGGYGANAQTTSPRKQGSLRGRYGRDAYRPTEEYDEFASDQTQATQAASADDEWGTYQYSMKDAPYKSIFQAQMQELKNAMENMPGEASAATSGSPQEVASPASQDGIYLNDRSILIDKDLEELMTDTSTASSADAVAEEVLDEEDPEEALDVLAALNGGVYLDIDEEEDAPEEEEPAEHSARGGRSHKKQANPRRIDGRDSDGSSSDAAARSASKKPTEAKPIKQSRWGGRG